MRDLKIRLMDKTEYERSKKLWRECFPDDSAFFIDHYYEKRTKPEYALGAFFGRSKTPAAMMHLLPMRMRFDGLEKNVCFVAGVCTAVKYRGMGFCGRLFERAFALMRETGFEAAVLQPFDPSFYERFGFRTFITRSLVTLSYDEPIELGRTTEKPIPDASAPSKLLSLYNEFTRPYSGCSVRDEESFRIRIEEFSAHTARYELTENGCCLGYEENGAFCAYELFFREGTDPVSLLPAGFRKYVFPLPNGHEIPAGSSAALEQFSMIKPISPLFSMGEGPFYGFDKY